MRDMRSSCCHFDTMKRGMVLEGGAMRGLYTAGVLDVLMKNDIQVDGYIGVSAGVTFGCNYKSRQPGRAIRYTLKYLRDRRFSGLWTLLSTGDIFGADFCYHEIPEKLDPFDFETFHSNPVELHTVATDAATGKPVYYRFHDGRGNELEWMRASASMPLVSHAVNVDGYTLFDGGVSDSIPIEYFMSIGYERNIVVLTRPRGYRKKEGAYNPLLSLMLKKYPDLQTAIKERPASYNRQLERLEELEKEGKVLIIAPSRDVHVKRVDKNRDRVRAIYDLGVSDTESLLDDIRAFLS